MANTATESRPDDDFALAALSSRASLALGRRSGTCHGSVCARWCSSGYC